MLSGGCPSFFKEDDKTFYQASGLLQRAEGTPAAAERAHLVREALRLMLKVKTNLKIATWPGHISGLRSAYSRVSSISL